MPLTRRFKRIVNNGYNRNYTQRLARGMFARETSLELIHYLIQGELREHGGHCKLRPETVESGAA